MARMGGYGGPSRRSEWMELGRGERWVRLKDKSAEWRERKGMMHGRGR